MGRPFYAEQFDERMKEDVAEIKTAMARLILSMNIAEAAVAEATEELAVFMERIKN